MPLGGTSLLLTPAQVQGSGTRAGRVAVESVDSVRPSRALRMKYKYLLGSGVQSMGRAAVYFRRGAKGTASSLAHAVAQDRGFMSGSLRILFPFYAPPGKGVAPPVIRPEALANALGITRTLSGVPAWRARSCGYSARYGCLIKYDLPLSKAIVTPVTPKLPPPVSARQPWVSKPDDVVPGHP